MISVLSDNIALEHDKLVITTSEVGSSTFLIALEGRFSMLNISRAGA